VPLPSMLHEAWVAHVSESLRMIKGEASCANAVRMVASEGTHRASADCRQTSLGPGHQPLAYKPSMTKPRSSTRSSSRRVFHSLNIPQMTRLWNPERSQSDNHASRWAKIILKWLKSSCRFLDSRHDNEDEQVIHQVHPHRDPQATHEEERSKVAPGECVEQAES